MPDDRQIEYHPLREPEAKPNEEHMELRHAAGNLLVVGLTGTELSPMERAWLKLIRPAGIILFKRNIEDAKQTRVLLKEAAAFCAPHAVRCVDVEGGTVNRLKEALTVIPSAQAVAQAMVHPTLSQSTRKDGAPNINPAQAFARAMVRPTFSQRTRKDGAPNVARNVEPALAHEHGELIARAVGAFGFNTTLAPVLDLALPDSAGVLGSRCAAREPARVIAYGRAFLSGLKSRGIVGCGKHFPGLGAGALDSHMETPTILRGGDAVWRDDLEPYRALHDELPMIMINHAAYPMTPGRRRPASVSSYWIESVLRKRIGYRGIVLSDDLEMGGILKFMPIEEAAIEAIRTGSDLIEICHRAEVILQAFEALVAEGERSAAFRKLLLGRARITERKRSRVFSNAMQPLLNDRKFEALRTRILRFGETVAAAQSNEVRA